MSPLCRAARFSLGPLIARGVKSQAWAEILLRPSNRKVHFTRGWAGAKGDEIPFRGCSHRTNIGRLGGAEGSLWAPVPGAGMLPRRWPRWDDVLAAAWASPEPPAACLSGTRAGAGQGAAQSRKKRAETILPVGMRPLYFPFTRHTWDQPGGRQQSPLTRRTRLSASPRSLLVLNPIPSIPRAGQAGHPPASNLLLRPGQSGGCSPALLLGGWDRESPQGNLGKENHILPHPVNGNTSRTADPSLGRDPARHLCCPLANASAFGVGAIIFFPPTTYPQCR